MSFTKKELESFRDCTVPDLIGDSCRLLFVGINPGLWTAATQTHFCHPSNRFYPALSEAGIVELEIDTNIGMSDEQRRQFVDAGLGVTNLVTRATVRASELSRSELLEGGARLRRLVERLAPSVVAVAGITAYRSAFDSPGAVMGLQPDPIAQSQLWVVPNPSGLNAHETVTSLSVWYRRAATAAGIA